MANSNARGADRRRNRKIGPNTPAPNGSAGVGAYDRATGKVIDAEIVEPRDMPVMPDDMNWTAEQWMLICWLGTPPNERDPITIGLLAGEIGVTVRTFSNWKNRPGFWDAVRSLARTNLERRLPAIYHALADQAERGSFPHIKLALELVGDYVEHYDFTSAGKPFPVQTFDYTSAIAGITDGSETDS